MAWIVHVGGRQIPAALTAQDEALVPVRAVAEALGLMVRTDAQAAAIYLEAPAPAPLVVPPCQGPVTNPFGPEGGEYPHNPWGWHLGIDLGVPEGIPILAPRSGVVELTGTDPDGLGNYIVIWHDGDRTVYGHLSRIDIWPGAAVEAGRMIGRSGNTGASTGPHLHFEVWLGCTRTMGDVYQLTRQGGGLPADPAPIWRGEWPTRGVVKGA